MTGGMVSTAAEPTSARNWRGTVSLWISMPWYAARRIMRGFASCYFGRRLASDVAVTGGIKMCREGELDGIRILKL